MTAACGDAGDRAIASPSRRYGRVGPMEAPPVVTASARFERRSCRWRVLDLFGGGVSKLIAIDAAAS
jgi:hypothetical protein